MQYQTNALTSSSKHHICKPPQIQFKTKRIISWACSNLQFQTSFCKSDARPCLSLCRSLPPPQSFKHRFPVRSSYQHPPPLHPHLTELMSESSAAPLHYDLVVRLFHGRGFPSPSGLERDAFPICVVGRFNGETLRTPPAEYSIPRAA